MLPPVMVSVRTVSSLLVCVLAAFALGCATYSQPAAEPAAWAAEVRGTVKQTAARTAKVTARSTAAASEAMGVAYHGVKNGFEDPDAAAYGAYPRDFATAIRKHMQHFLGVPAHASFQFGKPEKGYLNKGLLLGGAVAWQGYLVEVRVVEEAVFESQVEPDAYVVRMRDGDVVEVMRAEYASGLRWPEREARARAAEPVVANQD
jgi:hypothetical protein